MSWEPIQRRTNIAMLADVAISTKLSGKRKIPTVVIALRKPPAWLDELTTVDVSIGRDDHAGQVRITPGGAFSLRKFNRGQTRTVTVSAWRDCTLTGLKQAPCVFKDDGAALVIHLPASAPITSVQARQTAPAPKAVNGSADAKAAVPAEPRGKPGVAQPPVAKSWRQIQDAALREGVELVSKHDLPAYNKSRISKGLAPFAIA